MLICISIIPITGVFVDGMLSRKIEGDKLKAAFG